jgi:hypothetical protein
VPEPFRPLPIARSTVVLLLWTGRLAAATAAATSCAQVYLSFFLGRSWLLWPHFFLRQFLARGCRRA